VPVTVTVDVPGAAVPFALIVSVVPHGGAQLVGLYEAVTPDGRPVTVNVTAWDVPDTRLDVTVLVPPDPGATAVAGSAATAKSKTGGGADAATRSTPIMPQ
jgi:uncharacterized protein YfaP (DUF2135 family)